MLNMQGEVQGAGALRRWDVATGATWRPSSASPHRVHAAASCANMPWLPCCDASFLPRYVPINQHHAVLVCCLYQVDFNPYVVAMEELPGRAGARFWCHCHPLL